MVVKQQLLCRFWQFYRPRMLKILLLMRVYVKFGETAKGTSLRRSPSNKWLSNTLRSLMLYECPRKRYKRRLSNPIKKLAGQRTCDSQVSGLSRPTVAAGHHCTVVLGKLFTPVRKQYNLVLAKGVYSVAEVITAGLVESNGSLPPGLWLMSPVSWLPRNRISWVPSSRNRAWNYAYSYFGLQQAYSCSVQLYYCTG